MSKNHFAITQIEGQKDLTSTANHNFIQALNRGILEI